jgi:hypothetical protein
MRIIRLVSDAIDGTSRFVKATSAPIMIKPNSRIALKSLSLELQKSTNFSISNDNYYFSYSIGDKDDTGRIKEYLIQIPQGVYTQDTFVTTIKYLMNAVLSGVSATVNIDDEDVVLQSYGFEWNLSVTSDNKLSISFNRQDLGNIDSSSMVNNPNMTVTGNTYQRQGAPPFEDNEYNAVTQCKLRACKGGLDSAVKIQNSPSTCEFMIAFCNQIFHRAN